MSLKSTSFSKELYNYLLSKTNEKKSETWFCRRTTVEDNNAKINVSPNKPCTFLLFKAGVFLQIFFPRYLLFQRVLRTSVFLNSKYLRFLERHPFKTLNKRTQFPLLINQSICLIDL